MIIFCVVVFLERKDTKEIVLIINVNRPIIYGGKNEFFDSFTFLKTKEGFVNNILRRDLNTILKTK